MNTLTIQHHTKTYSVHIGTDLLTAPILASLVENNSCALIADSHTAPLYAAPLLKKICSLNIKAHLFTVPVGESSKTREIKQTLENQMLEQGFYKETCVIAIGGGVITDLGGFLASTYFRGVPLILIPTTLLAMVDACIGGKNGVNTQQGKNLIGTIYPPKAVIMDISTLDTLPERQVKSGLSEVIKHALIADSELFEELENCLHSFTRKENLAPLILRNCEIKQSIVEQDPSEINVRRLLNFGHTIGHALENISNYTLLHGEAIALGMIIESKLSTKYSTLPVSHYYRIRKLIDQLFPSLTSLSIDRSALLNALNYDKKNRNGRPRFILLEKIGSPAIFNGDFVTRIPEFHKIIPTIWTDCMG